MTFLFEAHGHCPICEKEVVFEAKNSVPIEEKFQSNWFRSSLKCPLCYSVPRERAIAYFLTRLKPNWRGLAIHESSPVMRGMSLRLKNECPGYVATQFSPDLERGALDDNRGWRNEDLESQTFQDESFDVVIALDVFEHLFDPGLAAIEIARTLKPGGVCLLSVPIVRPFGNSERRAMRENGAIRHLMPEEYHGSPVGNGRVLVTVDWSYDIGAYLSARSGLPFVVNLIDDMRFGIRDAYNIVLSAKKQVVFGSDR
jgi:SAM-dependent methyltransferase